MSSLNGICMVPKGTVAELDILAEPDVKSEIIQCRSLWRLRSV